MIMMYAVVDKLTNNKIGNLFTLGILYITNREEVKLDEMILKIPFYYTKRKHENGVVLLKFPKGSVIIFESNRYMSKEEFWGEFKKGLTKMNLTVISESETAIDDQVGYFISAWRVSDPSDFREYVTIPSKRVTVYFNGEKKDVQEFRNIVKQIRFVKEEQ